MNWQEIRQWVSGSRSERELREACREYNLPDHGDIDELRSRLYEFIDSQNPNAQSPWFPGRRRPTIPFWGRSPDSQPVQQRQVVRGAGGLPIVAALVVLGIVAVVALALALSLWAWNRNDGGQIRVQDPQPVATATVTTTATPNKGSDEITSTPTPAQGITINVEGAKAEASITTTSCSTCPSPAPQVVERVTKEVVVVPSGPSTATSSAAASASVSVQQPAPAPPPAPIPAPAPAPAPVGCKVIHEYPLEGLPEVATSGSHIHVEFWTGVSGEPERETMLPARDAPGGRFTLTRPLKGFVWEYAGCSDSEVMAQINAHIQRRLAGKANNAGFVPWPQTGFFQPAR